MNFYMTVFKTAVISLKDRSKFYNYLTKSSTGACNRPSSLSTVARSLTRDKYNLLLFK